MTRWGLLKYFQARMPYGVGQQRAELLPLRNRGLGPLAVPVLPIPGPPLPLAPPRLALSESWQRLR